MEDIFRVLLLVGGIPEIGVAAPWSVAGAAGRRELAVMGDWPARPEQTVESIAVAVERVGEGQRFVTERMADGRARAGGGSPARIAR